MILFGCEIPLWILLVAVISYLFYRMGTSTYDVFQSIGVPYDKPVPYFGNMLEALRVPSTEWQMKMLKKYPGRVHGFFQGRTPVVMTSDVDLIKEIGIKQFSNFYNRREVFDSDPTLSYVMTSLKDDHWKHIRSTVSPTFSSGKLKQIYGMVKTCTDKFVKHIYSTSGAPFPIKRYTDAFTTDVIATTAFGIELNTQSTTNHSFVRHSNALFGNPLKPGFWHKIKTFLGFLSIFLLPVKGQKFLKDVFGIEFVDSEAIYYFQQIVDQVLAENKTSLINEDKPNFIALCANKLIEIDEVPSESVKVTDGKKWSTEGLTKLEVMATAITFFAAGFDTTANTLQFFFYSMAIHPEIQNKLFSAISDLDDEVDYNDLQRLEYLDWCISETLRMFPPIMRFDRYANSETTIRGHHIPKNTIVSCSVYSLHHNPEYWTDPDTFNPDRFAPENKTDLQSAAWLPFGLGGRSCIGSRLALLELKVAAYHVIRTFRLERSADTPMLDRLEFQPFAGLLKLKGELKIVAVPRKNID